MDVSGGKRGVLNDVERRIIMRGIVKKNVPFEAGPVRDFVRKFVLERRQKWKKEKNEKALAAEAKFRTDDSPSAAWCSFFIKDLREFARSAETNEVRFFYYCLFNKESLNMFCTYKFTELFL